MGGCETVRSKRPSVHVRTLLDTTGGDGLRIRNPFACTKCMSLHLLVLSCQEPHQRGGGGEELWSDEGDGPSPAKGSRAASTWMDVLAPFVPGLFLLSTHTQQEDEQEEVLTHPECPSTQYAWLVTLRTGEVFKSAGGRSQRKSDGVESHSRCDAQMWGEMQDGLLGGKCAWWEDLNMVQTVNLIVYYISTTHRCGMWLHWLTNLLQHWKMLTVEETGSSIYRNIPELVCNFFLIVMTFQTFKIM